MANSPQSKKRARQNERAVRHQQGAPLAHPVVPAPKVEEAIASGDQERRRHCPEAGAARADARHHQGRGAHINTAVAQDVAPVELG